jgi:hypothetical protein
MKEVSDLLPRVMEVAPQCPEPTAVRHLLDAAIEFCRRTRIWRDCDEIPIDAMHFDVPIAVADDAQIFEISHISVKDGDGVVRDLKPVTMDWLDKNVVAWRDKQGVPEYVTQVEPDTLRVVPAPEDAYTLRAELILVPASDAEQLPDVLVDAYGQVIADGALARILALPSDFANPALAAAHGQAFESALGRWGGQVPLGQQRAVRRTRPTPFF